MKKTILLMTFLSLGMLTACPKNDEVKTFTATFQNFDGTQIGEVQTVKEGDTPIAPVTNPTRPEDDDYTYEFASWNPAVTAIHADTTYVATYTSTPKEKTVNKSALKSAFELTVGYVFEEEYKAKAGDWYDDDQLYSTGGEWVPDTVETIQSACETIRDALLRHQEYELEADVFPFNWVDDNAPGYEVDFRMGKGVSINVGTCREEGYITVYIEVFATDGYTLVDDIEDGVKTITFLDNSTMKADLTNANKRASFVTWMNGENDNLIESLDLTEGTYAQTNEFQGTDGKFITLSLGSGSKGCDLTFNFNYAITKIVLRASAYYKYDTYNQIYRGDTGSALYSGETLLKDFSRTDTNNKPQEETIEVPFDESKHPTSFNLSVLDANQRVFINEMKVYYDLDSALLA